MHGIVNLDKPIGKTSHDCVMMLRRLFQTKKVGHTGTLDPEVRGVLPICIGEATKIVPYLTDTKKTYQAEVTIGVATDTEDQTGKVIDKQTVDKPMTVAMVEAALALFNGEITQVTPLYSAVKVNGKKLYEYARNNIPVERPLRHVHIYALHLIEDSLVQSMGTVTFKIEATVSKGTYIRTLAKDIGTTLGYPAHMSHLVRTQVATFKLEDAVTFEQLSQLKANGDIETALLPVMDGLRHLPVYQVSGDLRQRVEYGQKLEKPEGWQDDQPYVVLNEDRLLAIYQSHPEDRALIKSMRGFNLT
ncbi:tRNA pseudouridine synthase B [Streptohalobacillus salinus]|uniref:tRNA pseudouridine synthase B n=1 Tax=Streptohalobacillus salinus TaxID=621096 RepID=A0A2V3WCM1_9BACI|nr:tRNA pseudouridine(55) synthase TruB [Streptohalobacillus salinus]PXW92486.1 tRNA pseudouridine synthase B [Streptohalobacillus salinus]